MNILFSLFIASIQAIGQVIFFCVLGALLNHFSVLDISLQRGLSLLAVHFFIPVFLFTNTAVSITPKQLFKYFPLPLYFLAFAGLAWIAATLASHWLSATPAQGRFITATLMFTNVSTLSMALAQSIATTSAFQVLKWRKDDTSEAVVARGVSYVVFFGIFANFLRWSYGTYLLSSDNDEEDLHAIETEKLPTDASESTRTSKQSCWSYMSHCILCVLRTFFNSASVAALLGLIVALTPLRDHLVNHHAFLYPIVYVPLHACGNSSISLVLICLGAQLWDLYSGGDAPRDHRGFLRLEDPPQFDYTRIVRTVFVLRLFVLPVLSITLVMLTRQWVALAMDPTFLLMLLILASAPTAVNLMTVCQANRAFEQPMALVLFGQYITSALLQMGWCMWFLWILTLLF